MPERSRKIDRRTFLVSTAKGALLAAAVGGAGRVLLQNDSESTKQPAEPINHGIERVEDNVLKEFAHFAKTRINTSHDASFWDSFFQFANNRINLPQTPHTQTIKSNDDFFTVLAQWPDEMRPDQEYAYDTTLIYQRSNVDGKLGQMSFRNLSFILSENDGAVVSDTTGLPALVTDEGKLRSMLDNTSVLNGNTSGVAYSRTLDKDGNIKAVMYKARVGKTDLISVLSKNLQMTTSSITYLNAKPPHTTLLA